MTGIALATTFDVANAQQTDTGFCGDGAGARGKDLPCFCGNRVITNTILVKRDKVTRGCPVDGLIVDDGVRLDLGGFELKGSSAGVGIKAGEGSTVTGGRVRNFRTGASVPAGRATLTDVLIHGNVDAGLVVGTLQGAEASATFGGSGAGVLDNDGAGIVIHPSAVLLIAGTAETSRLLVLRNGGVGIDVRGELHASLVEVGNSGSDGVRVDTTAPVEILGCDVHDSGNHPDGVLPDKAGILALQTDPEAGVRVGAHTPFVAGRVHDNSGHGIALGDASQQTGPVYGFVGDQQIYNNDEGIHAAQRDPVAQPTASTILSNNIYNNRGAGVHLTSSAQRYVGEIDERAFSGNDVHHNAVTGEGCETPGAIQTSSQIVVDGPITGTDPTVRNACDPFGVEPCAPCGADSDAICMGPNSNFDRDYLCYWGATNDGTANSRNATVAQCEEMNNPFGIDSGGINNHCVYSLNLRQCRFAWDLSGREIAQCDSSRNRIYAYVNNPNGDQSTQRGLFAKSGARVNARRNVWGVGGLLNATMTDSGSGSEIDKSNDCGTVSTCP